LRVSHTAWTKICTNIVPFVTARLLSLEIAYVAFAHTGLLS